MGIRMYEIHFLAGAPKGPIINAIQSHIFFDDQPMVVFSRLGRNEPDASDGIKTTNVYIYLDLRYNHPLLIRLFRTENYKNCCWSEVHRNTLCMSFNVI